MKYFLMLGLPIITGCTNLSDADWVIHPGEGTDSIAVEAAPGDYVCVSEASNPGKRSCVPRVHDEENPGES